MNIALLDYGLGNIRSLSYALDRIGVAYKIVNSPSGLAQASHIIVPGVGSFGSAIKNLHSMELYEPLVSLTADRKRKFLGICVGMQIFFESSDESPGVRGISAIKGNFERLSSENARVPHMGWNTVIRQDESWPRNFEGILSDSDFYFVHSYALITHPTKQHLTTNNGSQTFVAYLEHMNFTCVQFHPEKSHVAGLRLLKNWVYSQC
jgi:imidazole glycerol phosphate synthase glutamine amidotransferase subunit